MTRKLLFSFLMLAMIVALAAPSLAQQTPVVIPAPNPNANIIWPPPVYILSGQFAIRGSANLPGMVNYFLEFRPLNPDLSEQPSTSPWFPATLPSATPVANDILGTWDTRTAPDGVYELRLTVNVSGQAPVQAVVWPLRVENTPSPFATQQQPVGLPTMSIPTLPPVSQATVQPTFDPTPRVTARLNANVRSGDSVIYPAVGSLPTGQTVPILGISSMGTGWYYIALPNGVRGFISPSVVDAAGNVSNLQFINPPPPPATATPTPLPATATPSTSINLIAGNITLDPSVPKCQQTFNVYVDIRNDGSQNLAYGGAILVQDLHVSDGGLQQQTVGGFGPIPAHTTYNIGPIPITVSTYYNEQHRIIVIVDSNNNVPEYNEGDNRSELVYTLAKAGCP
jgi:SH3 domain-containing protein